MLTYFERRKRLSFDGTTGIGDLYLVKTWYLFGLIPVLRRYEQLTTKDPLPSER